MSGFSGFQVEVEVMCINDLRGWQRKIGLLKQILQPFALVAVLRKMGDLMASTEGIGTGPSLS